MSNTNHLPATTHPQPSPKTSRHIFPTRQNTLPRIYWLLWGILIALYLAWPLIYLKAYGWNNDEGLYLQRAALANGGYSLYSEAAFNKPPLLIWLLQLAFKVGGQTVVTGRLTILALTLIGFIALAQVAQQLWGRWAALCAAGLWLALPEIPVRAYVVTSDMPAVSFSMIALWAALAFRRNGRLAHLILASLTATATLLIHPLLIYIAAPLALILLWPTTTLPASSTNKPITKKEFFLFIGISITFVLLTLAAIDWRTFFQWVFTVNVTVAQNDTILATNWQWIITTLNTNWALSLLALLSSLVLYNTPQRNNLLIILIWLLAATAVFLVWSPLWGHYRIFLIIPIVLVASGGLATIGTWLTNKELSRQRPFPLLLTLLTLLSLIPFGISRWQATQPHLLTLRREWTADHLAVQAFLTSQTTADTFITIDDPMLAFTANRLVPPPLTEATLKMIYTGFFTTGDAIEATLNYQAPLVIFVTSRLDRLLGFEEWVTAVATTQTNFGYIRAYSLPPFIPAQPTAHQLGEGLSLQGYTLTPDTLRAGEPINLTLFWQRNGSVNNDYNVFIHIIDNNGQIVAQLDGPPLSQNYPTHQWREGLLLPDPRHIPTDPNLPPGTYQLIVGMYEWPSLTRLPAFRADGSRWRDDRILLTELTIP